jgi:hypothetical protein
MQSRRILCGNIYDWFHDLESKQKQWVLCETRRGIELDGEESRWQCVQQRAEELKKRGTSGFPPFPTGAWASIVKTHHRPLPNPEFKE